MNKKVAILLVLFNEEKHIERLAGSINAQSYKDISVYAIDNNSCDSSLTLLKKKVPNTIVITSKENLGYAKGNNILALKAIENNADMLFILNTDMEPEQNCIERLIEIMNKYQDVSVVCPIVYYGIENRRTNNIQCYAYESNFKNAKTKILYSGNEVNVDALPDELQVNSLQGGCFLIRSASIAQAGLFNEDNFMYNDEIDLAYRISKAGGKIIVTKQAIVWHYHDWTRTNKSGYYLQYYYMNRNRILYLYRYNRKFSIFWEFIEEFALFPLKVRWAKKTAGLKLIKYYYLGYWHGLLKMKGKADIEFR